MSVSLLAQAASKYGPEAIGHIGRLLELLKSRQVSQVVDVIQRGVEPVSRTLTDVGMSQAVQLTKQDLVPHLDSLIGSLNGHDPERKAMLIDLAGFLKSPDIELEPAHRTQLREILEEMIVSENSIQTPSPSQQNTPDPRDAEIKRLKEELAKKEAGERVIPDDPVEKILSGVAGIITGEFRNLSSEVGWAIKAYCKLKGIDLSDQVVNNYLKEFATGKFRGNLETYIKAKIAGDADPISKINSLTDNEKLAMNWVGKLIGVAGSTPKWVFDGLALFGTALDYSAELLHHVPVIGSILKVPFIRKFVVGLSQFAGRFAKDIELIADGSQILTGKKKPEEKKN